MRDAFLVLQAQVAGLRAQTGRQDYPLTRFESKALSGSGSAAPMRAL